jgi:hypothetical protein
VTRGRWTARCGPLWIALWLGLAASHGPGPHARAPMRHRLRTSSDERHQNRPYSDQTKRHPGSSDVGAHRPSPSLRRMAIAPASRCDPMMWQPRLRCRYVRPNKKKESPRRPGAKLEEKDFSGNEKAGRDAGLSASHSALQVSCCRPG